jgi:1,5-anhydro-D-fructose reductase (1,5-anhydro-D-mannitol-forming)
MLKIAMLSGWHVHAKGYANSVNTSGIATVSAIWDEDPNRGKAWADELNVPFFEHIDDICSNDEIEGVIVCGPTNQHVELMLAAAQARKHIFTEKVLALTIEDAQKIASAVETNKVVFSISYPHRTMAHNQWIKRILNDNTIGQPTLIRIRNAHNGSIDNWLPHHFYDPVQCGGGAMIDLGAHGMYLARWFLGQPRSIVSVFSKITNRPVEDNAVSVMEFDQGALAINETGFVTPASPMMIEVYGTKGSILVQNGYVRVYSPELNPSCPGWIQVEKLPSQLDSPVLAWLKALDGQSTMLFTIQDAVELTEMMVGAYQSSKTGKEFIFDVKS